MASILDSLRRSVKSYGDRRALLVFQMPEGYGGSVPGVMPEGMAQAQTSGLSKMANRAGEWVSSVLRARGAGKAISVSPTAKGAQAVFAQRQPALQKAAAAGGGVSRILQGESLRQNVSLETQNKLTSNFALQGANGRYQAASGLMGGGTAMLRAISPPAGGGTPMADGLYRMSGAAPAAEAAFRAVSGDGSAYREMAASSPKGTGGGAVVQVEMVNHNSVSSELDLDRVVSYLTDKVAEGLSSAAETVHW